MSRLFNIDNSIDYYCVIGNPVAHSRSPTIHAAFASQTGQVLQYDRVLVEADEFAAAMAEFRVGGGCGMNVTVPFKEEAFRLVDDLSQRAQSAGAVNTLRLDEGGIWHGDNTDGIGLLRDLTANQGYDIQAARILVCGAGGAARGVLPSLLESGPSTVVLANRTLPRARQVAEDLRAVGPITIAGYDELQDQSFDLIINATSLGLDDEVPPVPDDCLHPATWCYDMMYGSGPTAFQRWARQRVARQALDGLGMLVEQAAESFYIWRGVRPDTAPVIDSLRS